MCRERRHLVSRRGRGVRASSSLHHALDDLAEGPQHRRSPWDPALFRAWLRPWREAPKFVVSEAAVQFVDGMPDGERQDVCQAMIRAGVFRLPTPELVLEVHHRFRHADEPDEQCMRRTLLIYLKESPDGGTGQAFEARMIYEDGRGVHHAMPAEFQVVMVGDSEFQVNVRRSDWLLDAGEGLRFTRWLCAGNDGETYCRGLAIDLTSLVILTSTRGVVREPVTPSASSRRLARLRRLTPEFSHTVLDLDPRVRHLSGRTYTVEGRLVPRLHWRRGHQRNQRCGPGRAETRVVWVKAHLVGHDDQGRVFTDYHL